MPKREKRERAVKIAEFPNLSINDVRVTPRRVLIECNEEEQKVGLIYKPVQTWDKYPTSGWVVHTGRDVDEVSVGDFILLEEHGTFIDHTYYDVFEILLRLDDGSIERIWADLETEPVLHEEMQRFHAGQSDAQMSLADRKAGTSITFNCSDVVDWQIGQMANPIYNLQYVPAWMVVLRNEDNELSMYYLTRPEQILAVVEY